MNKTSLSLLLALAGSLPAAEPSLSVLEQQFRQLPPEARRLTGPLFWLHGDESREQLETVLAKVAEGGNGSFTAESRPHSDWLGPNWYRDVDICLAAAKKHGLKLWIFDEKWWPSQGVGGQVPPRYAAKQLEGAATEVTGPRDFAAEGFAGERYVAAVAGRVAADGAIEAGSLIDLAPFIRAGKLAWQVPEGPWKIMRFTHKQAPGLGQGGGRELSVDGASQDCVDWYLQKVYQPHYDRYKADFGKTIVGFFYDEPETRGDWGTEVNKVLAELGVDWKQAYVAYKFQLSGEAQAAARYQYLEARAEAWGRTMYGSLSRWCHERGVQSIGHFMEHGGLYFNQDFCAGDLMRVQKYSDMGGLDAVFSQFIWGQRGTRDQPVWQTPKLCSSISHAYGKQDDITMCEIFGARGQNLTYPEMKWWADHMHASGVSFLIPHSFNPRAPYDTDCPPYFYNGGFEPRFPLYRVFADYSSRLSVMLTGGRHVAPVALLSPGQSAHVGKRVMLEQISESLQDALYDCDWLPYEVFEKDLRIAGPALTLREESYRVLIVPPVEVIPHPVLVKAKAFYDQGGVVVAHGFLPTKSATPGKTAADIAQLTQAIWGQAQPALAASQRNAAGGRSYLLPEQPTPEQLQQVLAGEANIHPTLEVLAGKTDHWLHVLHRVKAGRDVFFIANQNHLGEPRPYRFRITAAGEPECWDPLRNEITSLPHTRTGAQTELSLTLAPNESVLLVFQPTRRALPLRLDPGAPLAGQSYALTRQPTTAPAQPALKSESKQAKALETCSWIWSDANAAKSAPPGLCYFRKQVRLPADREVAKATFTGTADNHLVLFVNGKKAGQSNPSSEGWKKPVVLNLKKQLLPGVNQLAIEATNATEKASPAGLIGQIVIEFTQAPPLIIPLDDTWKTSPNQAKDWTQANFNDAAWPAAKIAAPYGAAPWGRLTDSQITLSPVKADPFLGTVELPANFDAAGSRVFLELEKVEPEAAARVTINGRDRGGCIGQPLRLDVTSWVRPGRNDVRVEPFAPASARLVVESVKVPATR
jgi:hypothetical protein